MAARIEKIHAAELREGHMVRLKKVRLQFLCRCLCHSRSSGSVVMFWVLFGPSPQRWVVLRNRARTELGGFVSEAGERKSHAELWNSLLQEATKPSA